MVTGGGIFKTMTQSQLNTHINKKYPHINYKEGEDLNLNNMYKNEIKRRWLDIDNYPTIFDIVLELKISERQVYRLAKQNNLGSRWNYRKNK